MVKLSYYNSCLGDEDISLLEDGRWLNDNVIGFIFDYFENELFANLVRSKGVTFVSPEVGQLIKLFTDSSELSMILEPIGMKEKDYVMIPVNDNEENSIGGSHWSLLVYEANSLTFTHFDSCFGFNNNAASTLAKRLSPLLRGTSQTTKFVEGLSPRQDNGYDCGVYVISFVETICETLERGYDSLPDLSHIKSSEMTKQRVRFKNIIKEMLLKVRDISFTKTT